MNLGGLKIFSMIIVITLIVVISSVSLLFPELWPFIWAAIDTFMREHPWMMGVMEFLATAFLLWITFKHMGEARKLRLKPLYSQLVNMLILPLISTIDRGWKRENIRESFIERYGFSWSELSSKRLVQIRGSKLERIMLWDTFMRMCPDVTTVVIKHDNIIEQLREARQHLRKRLEANVRFCEIVKETIERHFASYDLEGRPESYVDNVIYSFVESSGLPFGYEREYWESHRDELQEAVRKLGTEDKDVEELVATVERLEKELDELPSKQEIIDRLRNLAKRYSEEYGITLQRPEWLLRV